MRSLLLIILLVLSTSLFSQIKPQGPYVEPILQKHVDNFIEDANNNNVNWFREFNKFDSILVVDFPNKYILGYCDDFAKKIYISRNIIDDDFLLKFVVYHEIGHCVLNYRHICDRISIMNPALNFYPRELYAHLFDQLIIDFFNNNEGIECPEYIMFGEFYNEGTVCPH